MTNKPRQKGTGEYLRRGLDGSCPRCGSLERYASGACAPCQREKARKQHKSRGKEGGKAFYRARNLRTRFNLTAEEYDQLLEAQDGRCAICLRKPEEVGKGTQPLAVDHDHSTYLVRGLLCFPCNSLIPNRKEVRRLLAMAVIYLDYPPAVQVLGERKANKKHRRNRYGLPKL